LGKHHQTATEKLNSNTVVDPETGCFEWQRGLVTGYGKVWLDGKWYVAHKLAWEALIGSVPEDKDLDHLCRNRKCWNIEHLEPVPHRINLLRGPETEATRNSAKTECKRGHPFDDENTGYKANGWRYCRACNQMGKEGRAAWDSAN
jgi:hypothetical protein